MNGETLGYIAVRAANRQDKSCEFKRAMLGWLVQWHYNLDEEPPAVIGGSWMIAARLHPCVQWPGFFRKEKKC